MIYFTDFPKIDYTYPNGKVINSTYLFLVPDVSIFDFGGYNTTGIQYSIQDGKSPDAASKEIYNNNSFFWVILLQNNIIDFYNEWPVSYHDWLRELAAVNSNFTFYTRYKMDIKKNDIVVKYEPTARGFFKFSNYGMVTAYDSFMRSFDVQMIDGEIKQNEAYLILRKKIDSYEIIQTPSGQMYQTLVKKVNKLDSAALFEKYDTLSQKKVPVSPYYLITNTSLISDEIDDIFDEPNCILSLYINSSLNLHPEIFTTSFKEEKEKEFIFNKRIKTVPINFLNRLGNRYFKYMARESEYV